MNRVGSFARFVAAGPDAADTEPAPMASLASLALLLVVCFMYLALLARGPGGDETLLPRVRRPDPGHGAAGGLVIVLDRDGRISAGGRRLSAEELADTLRREGGTDALPLPVARVDRRADFRHVGALIEACRAAGCRGVRWAVVDVRDDASR